MARGPTTPPNNTTATPGAADVPDATAQPFTEFGATGLRAWSGYVREEFLRELQGWKGYRVYREMRDNDPIIGAIFFAIEMLLRGVSFQVEPADPQNPDDIEAADFINSALADMEHSWPEFIAEVLTFLQYGFSVFELVYKTRKGKSRDPKSNSRFDDGMIGWRKFASRAQETTLHWEFDDAGDATAQVQLLPTGGPLLRVPLAKCLHFRTIPLKQNPEGRALTLDTPIPTPDGWKTMAELSVGDRLFDDRGEICRVVAKSPIWPNRPVYDLEFGDGEKVRADANHLWPVSIQGAKRLKTTEELFRRYSGKGRSDCSPTGPRGRYRLDRPASLDGDPTMLPVSPYALGAWLGDGRTGVAELCYGEADSEILAHIEASGVTARKSRNGAGQTRYARLDSFKDNPQRRSRSTPFTDTVKKIGKKHIPSEYMLADRWSRMELLRGLMDTDGGVTAGGYMCQFSQTDRALAEQVLELVRGLGYPARIHPRRSTESWAVSFAAYRDNAPFHLERKKLALRYRPRDVRTGRTTLKSVNEAGHAPTVCIEVNSASHEFICGKGLYPTHNSLLRNAYTSYFFKKRISEIEAVGIERDLAGLPIAWVPARILNKDASPDDKAQYEMWKRIIRDTSRNEQEGFVLPLAYDKDKNKLFDVTLLTTNGRRAFDTTKIIDRYDHRITATVLADFIVLGSSGSNSRGSFAQAKNKTDMFGAAITSFLDLIAAEFNRKAIPDLLELNGFEGLCKMTHGDVERHDLDTLGTFIQQTASVGALTPDGPLEEALRLEAGLPPSAGEQRTDLNEGGEGQAGGDDTGAVAPAKTQAQGQGQGSDGL